MRRVILGMCLLALAACGDSSKSTSTIVINDPCDICEVEPNNSLTEAEELGVLNPNQSASVQGMIGMGDEDWFHLTVDETFNMRVNFFTNVGVELDLEAWTLDENGNPVLSSKWSGTFSVQNLRDLVKVEHPGGVYLRIGGVVTNNAEIQRNYVFQVWNDGLPEIIDFNEVERNNKLGSANEIIGFTLQDLVVINGSFTGNDQDWFFFRLSGPQRLDIDVGMAALSQVTLEIWEFNSDMFQWEVRSEHVGVGNILIKDLLADINAPGFYLRLSGSVSADYTMEVYSSL